MKLGPKEQDSGDDARKMLLESGSLFMQPKNELCEHTGSKKAKVFIRERQIAPSTDTARERKISHTLTF